MLEGHLFLQPAGYLEGERDVIRLAPSVEEVKKQEGYITCQPRKEGDGLDERLPLHFCLRVIPAQVREGKQPRPAASVPIRLQVQVYIGCVLEHVGPLPSSLPAKQCVNGAYHAQLNQPCRSTPNSRPSKLVQGCSLSDSNNTPCWSTLSPRPSSTF